jgi:hypothetical protein
MDGKLVSYRGFTAVAMVWIKESKFARIGMNYHNYYSRQGQRDNEEAANVEHFL